MRSVTKKISTVGAGIALVLGLTACEDQPNSQSQETQRKQESYDKLTAGQPAKSMNYSPSRETINGWVETWDAPNKLSYVYMRASTGKIIGYYVLKGLPVSMCASLTPTFEIIDRMDTDFDVPAPAMDGVYYSGGQCNVYYGFDATTGAYLEFSVGNGLNYQLMDQPLPAEDVPALGFTKVEDVK